jgi:hypothetical protein
MMNNRIAFGLVVVAGFVGTVLLAAPALATTLESYLIIERAAVLADDEELRAAMITEGEIPTDGSGDAFGYGILTEDGDAILVATTHEGVLDSEEQEYILDPTWHNHFVRLSEEIEQCGADPGVADITWQSPGDVRIINNLALINNVPTDEFEGWDSITGEELSMTLGEDVSNVVSFRLAPVFGDSGLEAVCVTDITPAEDVITPPSEAQLDEVESLADDNNGTDDVEEDVEEEGEDGEEFNSLTANNSTQT